jgi:hypothetical protein
MAAKTGTYTLINSSTLGTATSTVTFSSIPSTYTDLIIVMNAGATALSDAKINFNSDTGTNYSNTYLWGSVSPNYGSARASNQTFMYACYYANFDTTIQNTQIINIMDYSNSTTNKSVLIRGAKGGTSTDVIVGLWRSTAPITTIAVGSVGSTFLAGSTFKLYGIEAAK